jgi:hypothetical protein
VAARAARANLRPLSITTMISLAASDCARMELTAAVRSSQRSAVYAHSTTEMSDERPAEAPELTARLPRDPRLACPTAPGSLAASGS